MVGVIVVLHPFARDLGFKPHLHLLMTEGGFDKKGHFIPKTFIPAEAMRKTWQYHVLTGFKKVFPKTPGFAGFIDGLFKCYPDGFYVYLSKGSRITSKRLIGWYVARYVRHPAIANTRIIGYDGAYARKWKFRFNVYVQESITQSKLCDFFKFVIFV